MTEGTNSSALKKFSTMQLLYFCLGFFGLQFAWQMRLALSGPVTEGLGADPLIYGLISLAGPFSGMVVQPIIGALSDNSLYWTSNGVDYYLTSNTLDNSEMMTIAESIQNSSSLVASTK